MLFRGMTSSVQDHSFRFVASYTVSIAYGITFRPCNRNGQIARIKATRAGIAYEKALLRISVAYYVQ